MATSKRLHVEEYSTHFSVEYGDLIIEAQKLDKRKYAVDVYDLLKDNHNNYRKSHRITEESLEVILDDEDSRNMDLWHSLVGYYCVLSDYECVELDKVFDDIITGKYNSKPKTMPKPQQHYADPKIHERQERKEFSDKWSKIFRNNE